MAADLESAHEKPTISDDSNPSQKSSEPEQTAMEQEIKNNIVDWDGPDDPQNPRNWPAWNAIPKSSWPAPSYSPRKPFPHTPLANATRPD